MTAPDLSLVVYVADVDCFSDNKNTKKIRASGKLKKD